MTRTTPEMIIEAAGELAALVTVRNADYGDMYAQNGLKGIAIELGGKFWRVRQLVLKSHHKNEEIVRDAFRDLAAYGLLGMILIDHPEIQFTEAELKQQIEEL